MWKWWLVAYVLLIIGSFVAAGFGMILINDGQRYLIFVGLGVFLATVLFDGCCVPLRDRALDKVLFCGRDPSASSASAAGRARVGPTTAARDDATVDLSALALVRAP